MALLYYNDSDEIETVCINFGFQKQNEHVKHFSRRESYLEIPEFFVQITQHFFILNLGVGKGKICM